MRAAFRRAGVVAAAAALLSACAGDGGGPAPGSAAGSAIRIGVVEPLSGPDVGAGLEAKQGAELAARLINEGSAVIAALTAGEGLDRQVTLVTADTRSRATAAALAAERLVAEEEVAGLVGAYDPEATAAASQRTERLDVPFVNGDTTASHLTGRGLDWFYRVGPTDRMLAEALFSVLAQQEAAGARTRRIAVVHPGGKQGVEIATTVRELAAEGGYQVAATVGFPAGGENLTAPAEEVLAAEPDAVFVVATAAADARRLVEAFTRLDETPPALLALGGGFAGPEFPQTAGPGAEGLFRSVAWSAELTTRNPAAAAVADAYRQTYGEPMTPTAAGTFMAVLTLARAIDAGGGGAQQVRTTLNALRTPGRGTIAPWDGIEFDAAHQNTAAAGAVEQVRDGQPRVVFPREVARVAPVWPPAQADGG